VNGTRHREVGEYLRRLQRSMRDLPADRRDEIVAEIEEHIAEDLAGQPSATDADVRNVLERVGDPDDIAAEARERFGVHVVTRGTPWLEVIALVFLVIPFLGWVVGMVLVWVSGMWTTRDKVIATVLVPGGVIATFLLTVGSSHAVGSGNGGVGPTEALVLWVTLLLGVPAAVYLGIRLRARLQP
jgi:uncharacterized membrane protein